MKNDKPKSPGRLNDLKHIIYKSADTPWRLSKKKYGFDVKRRLVLKENIDGEALKWALKKCLKEKKREKF